MLLSLAHKNRRSRRSSRAYKSGKGGNDHNNRHTNANARQSKVAVIEAIEDLFLQNLWDELATLAHMNNGKGVNSHIAAWCEMHGISLDHVETVRQKYFRIRKAYTEKGIDLRNFLRKKSGQE